MIDVVLQARVIESVQIGPPTMARSMIRNAVFVLVFVVLQYFMKKMNDFTRAEVHHPRLFPH